MYFCPTGFGWVLQTGMKKIAVVVQRYGLEVNGGAEYHCRLLAERLSEWYEVTVLTSCAKDYFTWANEYAEGRGEINGVEVIRFPSLQNRNKGKVHRLLKRLNKRTLVQQALRYLGLLNGLEKFFGLNDNFVHLGDEWSKQQGPYTPGLIQYLEDEKGKYDAFLFFTYLYYPTFRGLRVVPEKSILIPTAHDEPAIHLPVFKSFFSLPRAILYNTHSEKRMVNRLFGNGGIYSDVAGAGIEQDLPLSAVKSADLLKADFPYLLYVGRIDPGKGSDLMLDYFLKYLETTRQRLQLVLVGQLFMELPKHQGIKYMGFVTEEIKQALLQEAEALIMPSPHESLSIVTLESMANGVPVLANGQSEVLRNHIDDSGAGFIFEDFASFKTAVDQVLNDTDLRIEMGLNARRYVRENYNWEVVLCKFKKAIDFITG
jgi:glycosyltransferase involved in cell wall biosynthesis